MGKNKNASDNYSLNSGAIIEQVNIASLIDEGYRLGKKGTISQFEDNRQPVSKKEKHWEPMTLTI